MFNIEWLKQEAYEFVYIFIATFLVDYGVMFFSFYNGDWSDAVLSALYVGIGKTVIKTFIQMLFMSFGYTVTHNGFKKLDNED